MKKKMRFSDLKLGDIFRKGNIIGMCVEHRVLMDNLLIKAVDLRTGRVLNEEDLSCIDTVELLPNATLLLFE